MALSSFNLWQAGICALRKGQRHVQRSLDLKLANAVEFIEEKLDVQTDDVGQMLAQTRTEQRAEPVTPVLLPQVTPVPPTIAVYTRTHRVCVTGDACGAKS